jgi:hypothetical protein
MTAQFGCCLPVDSVVDPVPALQAVHQQATRQQAPGCQQLVLLVIWQGRPTRGDVPGNPGSSILALVCHQLHQQMTLARAMACQDMEAFQKYH